MMKKITLLLMSFVIFVQTSIGQQVVFEESFTNFTSLGDAPPLGWVSLDEDGQAVISAYTDQNAFLGGDWEHSNFGTPYEPGIYSCSNVDPATGTPISNWLISPPISLLSAPSIEIDVISSITAQTIEVRYTTSIAGATPVATDFTNILGTISTTTAHVVYSFDAAALANQTVYFAFLDANTDGDIIAMRNFKALEALTDDLKLDAITFDERKNALDGFIVDYASFCDATAVNVSLEITNVGTNPITTFDATFDNASTVVTETFTIPSLANGQSTTVTFATQANVDTFDAYFIDAWVSMSSDAVQSNDSTMNNGNFTLMIAPSDSVTATTPFYTSFEVANGLGGLANYNNAFWTFEDTDGNGNQFSMIDGSADGNSSEGDYALQLLGNATVANTDWTFSPCLYLDNSITYVASFKAKVGSYDSGAPVLATLELSLMSDDNSTAVVSAIGSVVADDNVGFSTYSVTFTPAASGVYNIGINQATTAQDWHLWIDEFRLAENTVCEAGVLSTTGFPASICTVDSFTIATDGSESTPNEYGLYFSPQASGSGATGAGFTFPGVTFPFETNSDLNGALSSLGYPVLEGEWAVYTTAIDLSDAVCSVSLDSIIVNFLDTNDVTCAPLAGVPCTTAIGGPYGDLNDAGGAPCDAGSGCVATDAGFTTFGVYASEVYLLNGVQAGFDYEFDMCSGVGAGAWMPAITIVAPSGAIDAFNLGTTGTFATNCMLPWTATESGTYEIFIHEAGESCSGGAQTDNGNPTVSCGPNAATCLDCTAGGLVSAASMIVCSNSNEYIILDGTESTPGSYTIAFDNAAGGTGAGDAAFTIGDITSFPWSFDNDLEGILSGQTIPLPPLEGLWELTIYNEDAFGELCDSVATVVTVNFLDSTDALCVVAVPCSISGITYGAQTDCFPSTNTYAQNVTVTYSDAPSTGTLDINGQSFAITSSPQTETLVNLVSDGNPVNVLASFSADAACTFSQNDAFLARENCQCSITDAVVGTQTACDNGTNLYTQVVTVYSVNGPTTGNLVVNGQSFPVSASPQEVTLVGLNSDGLAVDLAVSFSEGPVCVYNETTAFTAPTGCLCPTISVSMSKSDVTNCSPVNGSATAVATGGSGTYTYVWSPSGTGATISNIAAGSYSVVATDVNGCTGTGSITVNNASGFSAILDGIPTNVSCNNGNDGAINTQVNGGGANLTYLWSDQTVASNVGDRNDLTAGSYSVFITDVASSCTFNLGPVSITEPDALVASVTASQNVTCNGGNNGSIDVDVTGGNGNNTYAWSSGGGNAEDASGLTEGVYTLTVTDAGCAPVTTNAITISEPNPLTISYDSDNDVTCFGENNGNVFVTVTGGNAPLTYAWSNGGGSAEDAQNLGGGTYQLTVTDDEGCPAVSSASYTISEPAELVVSILDYTDETCFGNENGTITADITGGTGAMDISWTNTTSSSLSLTGLAPNSYQLSVTDDNNCSTTSTIVTIAAATELNVTTSSTNESTSGNDGTASVVASGGASSYNYLWTPSGQTTAAASGLSAGSYNCTIEDGNGCKSTVTVVVEKGTSIGEIALDKLAIFPNPSKGTFTVSFETLESLDFEISMFNTIGKKVYTNSFDNVVGGFTEQIAVQDLSNGIYFLEISNRDAKSINKITISK